jgi:cytochrome P450
MDFAELCRTVGRGAEGVDLDPYATLAWLRSTSSVSKVPGPGRVGSVWFVTSYALARACLADPRLSFDPHNSRHPPSAGREPYILAKDAPEHTRLRQLVTSAFSPGAMARLRPAVEAVCRRHIAAFAGRGSADLLADYAWLIPEEVASELLGIPDDVRLPTGRGTTLTVLAGLVEQTSGGAATDELWAYVDTFVAARARHPGDDLTSVLLAAADRGDVSMRDVTGMAYVLFTTAQLSTAALVATSLLRVLATPSPVQDVQPAARGRRPVVEETLRHGSPVQTTMPRYALTDLELGGQQIAKGDEVVVSLAGANRDPDKFGDGDEFRLGPGTRTAHLGFGHGVHFCLGAPLARMEAEVAMDTVFQSLPSVRLAVPVDHITWGLGPMLRYPRAVPVTFDPVP